jgi:hypothetical protein
MILRVILRFALSPLDLLETVVRDFVTAPNALVHCVDVAVVSFRCGSGVAPARGDQSDSTGSHQSKQLSSFQGGVPLFPERR